MAITPATAKPGTWSDRVRATLHRYDEPLLRQVAARLLRPRNQWPVEELVERSVDTLTNAIVIDRRLKDLPPAARKLLAALGLSGQPSWRVGQLLALLAVLGHTEGLTPVQALLDAGLLYPELPESLPRLTQWEDWLGPDGVTRVRVFAPPAVTARARGEDLGLPVLTEPKTQVQSTRLADGLEWPLRLAVAWQQIGANPIRLTQQEALFKRDLQRLQTDPLLNTPFAEQLAEVAEPGVLALEWALAAGLLESTEGGLGARPFSEAWDGGLLPVLASLCSTLLTVERWDPLRGYFPADGDNPFPSAALAIMLLLGRQPDGAWVRPEHVAEYLGGRHPSWASVLKGAGHSTDDWVRALLLGVAQPLRLVEAAEEARDWSVRLSAVGRHLFAGGPAPAPEHAFPQTLVMQPNGEIVVFRQGLTPELIGKLSRFAAWKTLGAACTMELQADTVYRGLESGLSLQDILQLLQQRGSRALPPTVLDSLQRWADKRERVTVYPAATLVEFLSRDDLESAFTRGLIAAKVTDRIGLVADGQELDYRHFRLVGNRDYEARPQQCVRFERDGVTFTVDTAQSDLLLEAELGRIAEPAPAEFGARRFVLTPASLRSAQARGLLLGDLEQWSVDRAGHPLSPAARLLFLGAGGSTAEVRQQLVVHLPNESVTDGVVQWPATGLLVEERLGPCAISVAPENLEALSRQLAEIGVEVKRG